MMTTYCIHQFTVFSYVDKIHLSLLHKAILDICYIKHTVTNITKIKGCQAFSFLIEILSFEKKISNDVKQEQEQIDQSFIILSNIDFGRGVQYTVGKVLAWLPAASPQHLL